MQNPYNRYQQNQKTEKKPQAAKMQKKQTNTKTRRAVLKANTKSSHKTQWSYIGLSVLGLGMSFYIFMYTDQFLDTVGKFELSFSSVLADDGEKAAPREENSDANKSSLPVGRVSQLKSDADHLTMKNASVYKALKKKEEDLEKKERRLAQLEEELQVQKEEIEKQLKEMNEMRRNISSKLDKKVTADQESLEKLVGVYSSMKPQNAATIISQIDDELAVKVLGQMKKTNAAEILNYIEPKKARMLSEKFTGLKK